MRHIFGSLTRTGDVEFETVESKDFDATCMCLSQDSDVIAYAQEPFYGAHREEIEASLTASLRHRWVTHTEVPF